MIFGFAYINSGSEYEQPYIQDAEKRRLNQLCDSYEIVKNCFYLIPSDLTNGGFVNQYGRDPLKRDPNSFDTVETVIERYNSEINLINKALNALIKDFGNMDIRDNNFPKEKVLKKLQLRKEYYISEFKKIREQYENAEGKREEATIKNAKSVERGGFFRLLQTLKDSAVGGLLQKLLIMDGVANTVSNYYDVGKNITAHIPSDALHGASSIIGKIPSPVTETIQGVHNFIGTGTDKIVGVTNQATHYAGTLLASNENLAQLAGQLPFDERLIQMILATAVTYMSMSLLLNRPIDYAERTENRLLKKIYGLDDEEYKGEDRDD